MEQWKHLFFYFEIRYNINAIFYVLFNRTFRCNSTQIGGEDSARDFSSEKGSFSQAYFVYLKKK